MTSPASQSLPSDLQALLADVFQVSVEEITPDLAFGDLPQWDSLGHMDLMIRLEEQYGVEVDTDLIAALVSVPAIARHLKENGHA